MLQVFQPLLHPWIERLHQHRLSSPQPPPDWGSLAALTSRLEERPEPRVHLLELRLSRSLSSLPFLPRMATDQLRRVEKLVGEALPRLGTETQGVLLSLESHSWSEELVSSLQRDGVLFDHSAPAADRPLM